MATKNIDGKNKNGKWVRIPKVAALKAIESAKIVDDVLTVQGIQLEASSISLDPNGSDALETENVSITPNALLITSIPPSVLAPQFALVAGASLDINIIAANTGAVTINVDGLGVKAIQMDGAPLGADELELGITKRITYDGVAFQLVTDATKAASKAVDGAAIGAAVASAAASAAAALVSENNAAADKVLTAADVVLADAAALAAAASAAAAAAAATASVGDALYGAMTTAVGAAAPVAIDTVGINSKLQTTAAGGAFTLGVGDMIGALDGREKVLILEIKEVGVDAVVTPSAMLGGLTTITFSAVGQTATLIYVESLVAWVIKSLNGAVAA
ncbi:MAG: hypothetical protein Q7W13_13030 [Bacteroidia bacterium]|nr:hypothetical protein [Bacteroidia bacterium]